MPAELSDPAASPFAALESLSDDSGLSAPIPASAGYKFPEAGEGKTLYGLPGWVRQADILAPIAPVITVRDDTFTVRAYGDARDDGGNILAAVWCEAVVQRSRDYCDPSDPADSLTRPLSTTNQTYGRKMKVISFRWINASEV